MTSTAFSATGALEKMGNADKDFRYMACSDLMTELKKENFKLDSDPEKKLTAKLLKLLEDNSRDVQSVAAQCIGALVKKAQEAQVIEILEQLVTLLLKDGGKKDQGDMRDIASLGLKFVIENLNAKDGPLLVKRVSPRLLTAIQADTTKAETKLECLSFLEEILTRYGSLMTGEYEKIQAALLPQLNASRPGTRKRAIGCLATLAVSTPDALFNALMEDLLKKATDTKKSEQVRTYIQAIGSISVSVGYRVGKYLGQIVPLVTKYAKSAGTEDEPDEELRENCLQTFEALVLRCPKEIQPHLEKITALALTYLKHDPNYAEGDEDQMDTEEDEEEDDDGDYSADDDTSWKVRRASARILAAVISTRPEMLPYVFDKVSPTLTGRFKEREESVKGDIFNTFIALLKQTNAASKKASLTEKSAVSLLKAQVPQIIAATTKQLKEKSIKTRIGAFVLLKELVQVLGGGLDAFIKDLVPGITNSLGDKSTNSNLKIETLSFLRVLLATHPETVFHPHIKALSPPIIKAVNDSYYKITAEALRVCCELVRVLRPAGTASFDFKPFVKPLFDATFARLKATDTDQEVKETAINCIGLIIATLGDELGDQLKPSLTLLQERLANEITRLTAVKAFARIAASKVGKLDIAFILPDTVKELSTFLRKQNRQLKQAALNTLDVIVNNYGKEKAVSALYPSVLAELAPLIADSDLHLSHLALQLSVAIIKADPESIPAVKKSVLKPALTLVESPLLQGAALQSLLSLFADIKDFDNTLESLWKLTKQTSLVKQTYSSIAQSIAVITVAADTGKRESTVTKFVGEAEKASDPVAQQIALLSLGEIGRRTDLSKYSNVQAAILKAFDGSDDVKSAASYALGNLAVGNLDKYLPFLLQKISDDSKNQYLLLHSLREVISRASSTEGGKALKPHLAQILPLLFNNTESSEEGTRNVVAECLGKLIFVDADTLIPQLKSRIASPSPFTRSTVVASLKYAISDAPAAIDNAIYAALPDFLDLLKDPELDVRKHTLLTLNWTGHSKPGLVRDHLPKYLPLLYGEAKVKKELIVEVDLGPFKHKVDKGLENRKAAFEVINTLLENCIDKLDVTTLNAQLAEGLKDPSSDIKMLTHLMIIRVASLAGAALVESLDSLVEPLRETVTTKPPPTAVPQDIKKNDEVVRSALRAIVAIARIETASSCLKFEEFLRTTVKTGELADKYEQIRQQEEPHEGDAMDVSSTPAPSTTATAKGNPPLASGATPGGPK